MRSDWNLMSAQSGLAFELHALERELQAFDVSAQAQGADTLLPLVRAARRISHLANEVAAHPRGAEAARDEVSLARVTDACLAEEGGRIEPRDLEAAIALIAKRLGAPAPGADREMGRVRRTLAAIANLPGAGAD
jgi:hypothetical protein